MASPAFSSSASHGEEAAAGHGWVKTDTFRVMNFAVLAIGLFILLKKPVAQALGNRIKDIKEELANLEAKKLQAEKELEGYKAKLSKLENEEKSIIDAYIKQGEDAKAKILKEADAVAHKLEEQAKKNIEHEFNQAKKQLTGELITKSLLKAEKLISSKITSDDQDQLADEYLKKVVA
jgi:F-type H+-transporting ATPase subunit b